jgi:hypothetical protein
VYDCVRVDRDLACFVDADVDPKSTRCSTRVGPLAGAEEQPEDTTQRRMGRHRVRDCDRYRTGYVKPVTSAIGVFDSPLTNSSRYPLQRFPFDHDDRDTVYRPAAWRSPRCAWRRPWSLRTSAASTRNSRHAPFGGRADRSEREVGAAVDLDACRGGAGRRRDVDRG